MQRFVETFDEPAYAVDRDLTITAWNHRAEQTFGWAAEDAIGRSANDRLPAGYDQAARRRRVAAMLAAGWWAGPTVLLDRHEAPHLFDGACWRIDGHYLTVLHAGAKGWRPEEISLELPGIACPVGTPVPRRDTSAEPGPVRTWHTVEAERNFRKVRVAYHMRRLRLQRGLSQTQVAEYLTETSPTGKAVLREHVAHWERADKECSSGTLERLAVLFDCQPEDFYAAIPNGQETAA